MRYLKKVVVLIILIVLAMPPDVGTQEATKEPSPEAHEISVWDFIEELLAAVQANDVERIQQLITNNPNTAEQAQLSLGVMSFGFGSGKEAEFFRELADKLEMFRSGDFSSLNLSYLLEEGKKAYDASDYPAALEKWQAGLNQARTLNNKQYIGFFLGNIGLVYDDLGLYQRAVEYYEQALAIQRELDDRQGEASVLTNLGRVYTDLGQYQQALKYYEQSLAIERELGNRNGEGADLTNIGVVYYLWGQYQQALKYHEQALVIHRELGNRRREGITLNIIGLVYRSLGKYQQALESGQTHLNSLILDLTSNNRER